MEENNNIVENKKSNKGLIIVLIIIILGLAGYICYDKFYTKTETNNNQKENEQPIQQEEENKEENPKIDKDNIPAEDKYALSVDIFYKSENDMDVNLEYYMIDDGKLYYKKITEYDIPNDYYYFGTYDGYKYAESIEKKDLTLLKGLDNIKRIKGSNTLTTDHSFNVILITDDGRIYFYDAKENEAEEYEYLKDYKIDDIIEFNIMPFCICEEDYRAGDECIQETCGGEFKIKTQDGMIVSGKINFDGTITEE